MRLFRRRLLSSLATLGAVMEKRQEAVAAYSKRDFAKALVLSDEAAKMLEGIDPGAGSDMQALWQLERDLGSGKASYESNNWTRPMLSMSEQLTLVLVLLLAFGLIFELPLVMAVLSLVGLVKASFLFKYQRHAFVVCLIAAAIITPTGDAVNLSLMAGPMLACYELGVLLVWIIEKRRKQEAPGDAGDEHAQQVDRAERDRDPDERRVNVEQLARLVVDVPEDEDRDGHGNRGQEAGDQLVADVHLQPHGLPD